MALWWAITSHPHKHGRPLALSAFPPVAVQLSDSLDLCNLVVCTRRHRGSKQVWFVDRHPLRSLDDLYCTFPQCFTLSRQSVRARWRMGGVEADQARYRSRNSPATKKLFFTATESVCMCGFFTLDTTGGFGFHIFEQVLCCNKCSERQIYNIYIYVCAVNAFVSIVNLILWINVFSCFLFLHLFLCLWNISAGIWVPLPT